MPDTKPPQPLADASVSFMRHLVVTGSASDDAQTLILSGALHHALEEIERLKALVSLLQMDTAWIKPND